MNIICGTNTEPSRRGPLLIAHNYFDHNWSEQSGTFKPNPKPTTMWIETSGAGTVEAGAGGRPTRAPLRHGSTGSSHCMSSVQAFSCRLEVEDVIE